MAHGSEGRESCGSGVAHGAIVSVLAPDRRALGLAHPSWYEAELWSEGIHAWSTCVAVAAPLFWWAMVHGRHGRLSHARGRDPLTSGGTPLSIQPTANART